MGISRFKIQNTLLTPEGKLFCLVTAAPNIYICLYSYFLCPGLFISKFSCFHIYLYPHIIISTFIHIHINLFFHAWISTFIYIINTLYYILLAFLYVASLCLHFIFIYSHIWLFRHLHWIPGNLSDSVFENKRCQVLSVMVLFWNQTGSRAV